MKRRYDKKMIYLSLKYFIYIHILKNCFLINFLFYRIFIINFARDLKIRRMYDKILIFPDFSLFNL